MSIRTILKRTAAAVVTGAANFAAKVRAGTRLSITARLIAGQVHAGTLLNASRATLLSVEHAATRVTTFASGTIAPVIVRAGTRMTALASGTVKAAVSGGSRVTQLVSGTSKNPQRNGGRVVRIQWGLVHANYVQTGTASQDAGGSWSTIANFEGAPDASAAHLTGGLVLVTGTLRGAFAAQPNRPASLVISKVELIFTVGISGITLLETMIVGYRVGALGVPHNLETLSANTGGASTRTYDITAALSGVGGEGLTWANMASLQPFIIANAVVNSIVDHAAYGCRLRITAAETQTL